MIFKMSADRYIYERILEAYSELTAKNIAEVLALLIMGLAKTSSGKSSNQIGLLPWRTKGGLLKKFLQ